MKCVICNQRKGKRHCPAKNALICAQCCGEKRILEIDCPESCEYLQVGRAHEAQLENTRHLLTHDPLERQNRARILDQFHDVIGHLEYMLAVERRASRSLIDKNVAEALDLLLDAYRTEQRGILYEQTSNILAVDGLRRRLREILEGYRNPSEPGRRFIKLGDVIDCLGLLRELVQSHMGMRASPTSYVDYLARTMPRQSEIRSSGSSLIVPG